MKQNETYLTTKEVGLMLKVSRATLNRWRKSRKIKAKKFQGVVRYRLSDINNMMK
jgi:excisionase family DNA binding protein